MKIVLDRALSHLADCQTMAKGIPSLELMERAGRAIFESILPKINRKDRILILCGSGGNGGDGYVVARYLFQQGYDVSCMEVLPPHSDSCKVNRKRYVGPTVPRVDSSFDVIVDAVFGTGLDKEIQGRPRELLGQANEMRCQKFAIDVPSGLDATSGRELGILFRADVVFTIQFHKIGLFLSDFPLEGIEVLDIGILPPQQPPCAYLLEGEQRPDSIRRVSLVSKERFSQCGEDLLQSLKELSSVPSPLCLEKGRYRFLSDGRFLYVERRI